MSCFGWQAEMGWRAAVTDHEHEHARTHTRTHTLLEEDESAHAIGHKVVLDVCMLLRDVKPFDQHAVSRCLTEIHVTPPCVPGNMNALSFLNQLRHSGFLAHLQAKITCR